MPAIHGLACPHDCPRVEVCNHLNPGQGTNSSLCSLHTKRGLPLSQSVNPGHQSMSRHHTRLPARVLLRRVQMLWLFNRLPRDHYPFPRSGNHVPPVKQSRAPTDATSHTRTSRHEGNSNPFTAGHFNHSRAPVRPQHDQHAAQAPQGRTCTSAKVWHLRSWSPLLLR